MSARNLEWVDNRWHCAGRGIHAGDALELRAAEIQRFDSDGEPMAGEPGPWVRVRVESSDAGRRLHAHKLVSGLAFKLEIGAAHELRWPVDEASR